MGGKTAGNSKLARIFFAPRCTVPVVEGRGDVEFELAVAGEGDLDDGGAGGVVDGAPVVQVLDVVP